MLSIKAKITSIFYEIGLNAINTFSYLFKLTSLHIASGVLQCIAIFSRLIQLFGKILGNLS